MTSEGSLGLNDSPFLPLGIVTASGLGVMIWTRLSGEERIDLPDGGHAVAKRRWGRYVEFRVESNGDGNPDVVSFFAPGIDGMTNNEQPVRRLVDRDGDGRLEVEINFNRECGVIDTHLDSDADGRPDRRLHKKEAIEIERALRESLRRPPTRPANLSPE